MMELRGLAPNIITYQEHDWAMLTEAQQVQFRTNYNLRLEEDKKRAERQANNTLVDEVQGNFTPKAPSDSDETNVKRGRRNTQNDGSVDKASLCKNLFLRRLQSLEN